MSIDLQNFIGGGFQPSCLHLFSGVGGAALGFAQAGFRSLGNLDRCATACSDLEYLTGERASVADLATITPEQLREVTGGERPDVLFTSPPCKGFSINQPRARSSSSLYRGMNSLALHGIWVAIEAWKKLPPPLIVLENVPEIQARGRKWLDQAEALLRSYGYAVAETVHDCGDVGGLAQRRRRMLLVARHMEQVPSFLYLPEHRERPGIGDVIGDLPIPGRGGGAMHNVPNTSPLNMLRLAAIEAGCDFRHLPTRIVQSDGSVIDPTCVHEGKRAGTKISDRREGSMGVKGWDMQSTTVISQGTIHNGPWQVGDPRLERGDFTHRLRKVRGTWRLEGEPIDPSKRPRGAEPIKIMAPDGTWHRPMTVLELAALQGFPTKVNGEWLHMSDAARYAGPTREVQGRDGWRLGIGNAVPPPAARAIATSCRASLTAAHMGGTLELPSSVWVAPRREPITPAHVAIQ